MTKKAKNKKKAIECNKKLKETKMQEKAGNF